MEAKRAGRADDCSGKNSLAAVAALFTTYVVSATKQRLKTAIPKGLQAFRPGLARNELPWLRHRKDLNPERVDRSLQMRGVAPLPQFACEDLVHTVLEFMQPLQG